MPTKEANISVNQIELLENDAQKIKNVD